MLIPDFPRTSPEQQGIASSALLQFVEALESQIHELHSFMLLRHDSVVAEGWWSPYRREHPHMVFSLSKSFTSTAVGLAVAEGRFSIDDAVLSFFPDEAPTQGSDFLAAMRVRHLLSMSTGHTVDTWPAMLHRPDGNWIKGFLDVPVLQRPGEYFLYNTGATYMLSAIVQKTTGTRLIDYLQSRLFEPLGIENATWEQSPQGITTGGIGLKIKTEDIARFGQFYLQKGFWQGRQLLSGAWITRATAAQISNGANPQSDWAQGYGYQFWHCRHGAYRGDGVFGQYCIIMPQQDAVLAITGGIDALDAQQPLNLVWDILLPAMGNESLPIEPASEARLREKLSSLTLLPVQGRATSPIWSQIAGRTYALDANDLLIETITLNVTRSGWMVSIKTPAGTNLIPCGYDVWQPGQTALLNNSFLFDPTPVVASGAWTAEESFTMVVRLYETPFFHTLIYHFVGDEMIVETRINVSFETTKTLLLTAHAL